MIHQATEEDIKKLQELIEDMEVGMLTTIDDDGAMRSRPMATQSVDYDGSLHLWFYTKATAPKVHDVDNDSHVNISYADPDQNNYVSVSGRAKLVHDREKIRELWTPLNKAWFPDGVEDPDIALIDVEVAKAEYWTAPSSTLVHAIGFVKALATGRSFEPGENEKVNIRT